MKIKKFTFRRTPYYTVRDDSIWNLKMYVNREGGTLSKVWSLKLIYAY